MVQGVHKQLIMSFLSLISILYIFQLPYLLSAYIVANPSTNYKYQPQQYRQQQQLQQQQKRYNVFVSSTINPIRIQNNDISMKSSNVFDMDAITTSISYAQQTPFEQLSSLLVAPSISLSAVTTLDPTTFLSDIFSNVLGTPLILAIPIVAALLVASLIAFFIVSYANPAEEDD